MKAVAGFYFWGEAAGVYIEDLRVTLPATPPPIMLDMLLESLKKLVRLNPKMLCYTHFGLADNAIERLRLYANQLNLWALTIREGIENNDSLDFIKDKLLETLSLHQNRSGLCECTSHI